MKKFILCCMRSRQSLSAGSMNRQRWLASGSRRSRWAITNTMPFRAIWIGCGFSCIRCGDCGGRFWFVAVNVGMCRGSGILRFLIAGFLFRGCCIHILARALPPNIRGRSNIVNAHVRFCAGLCQECARSAMLYQR